jgi:hypothetical protein
VYIRRSACRHQHITGVRRHHSEDITEHFACWNLLLFVGRLERTHVRCDGTKTREIAVHQVSGSFGVGDVYVLTAMVKFSRCVAAARIL